MTELFGPFFCLSLLKVSMTQILRYSLDLKAVSIIQESFLRLLNFLQIKEGRPDFLGGTNSAEWLSYLFLPSVFHF